MVRSCTAQRDPFKPGRLALGRRQRWPRFPAHGPKLGAGPRRPALGAKPRRPPLGRLLHNTRCSRHPQNPGPPTLQARGRTTVGLTNRSSTPPTWVLSSGRGRAGRLSQPSLSSDSRSPRSLALFWLGQALAGSVAAVAVVPGQHPGGLGRDAVAADRRRCWRRFGCGGGPAAAAAAAAVRFADGGGARHDVTWAANGWRRGHGPAGGDHRAGGRSTPSTTARRGRGAQSVRPHADAPRPRLAVPVTGWRLPVSVAAVHPRRPAGSGTLGDSPTVAGSGEQRAADLGHGPAGALPSRRSRSRLRFRARPAPGSGGLLSVSDSERRRCVATQMCGVPWGRPSDSERHARLGHDSESWRPGEGLP